ncbi:MAG: hypothetical protein Q9211_003497 [Gyalolechia sp. 1 TL-2023]
MASSTFQLGETAHDFINCNLRLLQRSTLQLTLPQSSVSYQDPQELIGAGFWITRGNGLTFSIRIETGTIAGLDVGREWFANGLVDVLCAAKLWPQLSLKASCLDRNSSRLDHQTKIALALSHADSRPTAPSKAEHILASPANVHDVKPPAGIRIGFLDSIELAFTLLPLASPHRLLPVPNPVPSPEKKRKTQARKCAQPHLRSHAVGNGKASSNPLDRSAIEDRRDANEDILFLSPTLGIQAFDVEMLDSDEENKDDLLFADLEFNLTMPTISKSPLAGTQPQSRHPPSSLHHPSPNLDLDLLKLIDASLRHTISGAPSPTRSTKKSIPSDITLAKPSSSPTLAEVAPVLFRPGYMQAISHRAPFIPRIASSLSAILSRSRSRTPNHGHHPSTTPANNNRPSPQPPPPNPQAKELQPPLWHLLQTRKWPTTPLEPLECPRPEVFERCEREGAMLLSSSPSLPASTFASRSGGGGSISAAETKNGEAEDEEEDDDDDADMLDTHPYHCGGGHGMLDDNDGEEEEDLFSSSVEGTPFASQEMGGAGDEEEMLDDEGGYKAEVGLLLEEERWSEGSRGRFSRGEETGADGSRMRIADEEGWGMLF